LTESIFYVAASGTGQLLLNLLKLLFHKRNFVCDDGDLSPPLVKEAVTVTTTFSKWNLQFFKQL